MADAITQALGAAYLIWIGVIMSATGGHLSSIVFKVFPVGVGVFMAFNLYARFMGWPL
jgi:hypothetical protein